ncbi:ATPase [Leucobacter sp. gxy201]|uniref:N-acetylglucosamine kinase n=1 Tax=Leucobacter sp. gxy201 TaxID=2957200 RepID=UPI003DA168B7
MTSPRLVLGLDVGGSKTHAVLSDGEHTVAEVLAGSANPASVGLEEAAKQLRSVFAQIGQTPIAAIVAGVAGADSPPAAQRFRELVAINRPGVPVEVVHDSELLLATAGLESGVAVISGTGSAAWARDERGGNARAGGWGYLLGDEGSGYWVTRMAMRHALERIDLGKPADHLSQQLAADCGLQGPEGLLDHFTLNPERRFWAARARVVFELAHDGDPAALAIVSGAADHLVFFITSAGGRLGITGPVVLAGGQLVHQPQLQRAVRERLEARGFNDIRVLDRDPVHGAVALALKLAA